MAEQRPELASRMQRYGEEIEEESQAASAETLEISEEARRQLEALGYLD